MDPSAMIDWESDDSDLLFNPRSPENILEECRAIKAFLDGLKGHIAIATSGTGGKIKWTALSKRALLCSAEAVNHHLDSSGNDVWLNPLPLFHVGGIGIAARSFLSGAKYFECRFPDAKWNPDHFMKQLEECRATLTSLVPTHVFDLVKERVRGPDHLRAIIVGGGALNEEVYRLAVELGWRLLPSYGLTECCSQVATAKMGSWKENGFPLLQPLKHIDMCVDPTGFVQIKSEALLSGFIERGSKGYVLHDPKRDGWYTTEDVAMMRDQMVVSVGRSSSYVKIGGESVDLNRLEGILQELMINKRFQGDAAIVPISDLRLGHVIHLKVTQGLSLGVDQLIDAFNRRVYPYEKIRSYDIVEFIPKTALGKINRSLLEGIE